MLIMSMSSRVNKVTVYMENLNRYLENLLTYQTLRIVSFPVKIKEK